ncbi:MAG TPA: ATP-binding protein [Rhodopila sp.]|uniref:ATP-binding protein n=1 Tax=Rhodopila sp. TaxID=2480087 RepID=UPI002CA85041|nr:ATP-binding protein [Rhodopila sp.]HVY14348.1 ATP-binding protein [Rhodopila sp.]
MTSPAAERKPRRAPAPLFALILGLPVVFALAGLSAWELVTSNRQAVEASLSEAAKSAAMALDAKLTGFQAAGLALAATDEVQAGVIGDEFQEETRRIADLLGVHVVVMEAAPPNEVLLNTLLPIGRTPFPRSRQPHGAALEAAIKSVVASAKPEVTDIFVGSMTRQRTVAVVLPVVSRKQVNRIIIMAFPADNLAVWLAQQIDKGDEFAGIRDGNGRIVAASRGSGVYPHYPVMGWTRQLPNRHGILEGTSPSGVHTLYAYQHLALAPTLAVVLAHPVKGIASVIEGPVKWLVIAALIMIVLGVLSLATVWMRRESENAALQELNLLLSDVPAILYVNHIFPDGRFRRRFLSQSAERVTGWPNSMLERPGAMTEKTDPCDAVPRDMFFRQVIETGRSQFEFRMRFANGTFHWMRSVGVCLRKEADGSGDVLGFITDVSEERAMRDELRRTEKFALLGEVAGRVSHEMNQPMAAISLAAENGLLALDRPVVNAEAVREKFVRIQRQVQRIVAIIGHIGTFTRKDIAADLIELDIGRVIHAALAVAEPRMAEAGVSVRLNIPPDLPPPKGVAVLVEQIIVNLIVNACDAYQDHCERNERVVSIDACVEDQAFVLRVSDKAGGIPPGMLGSIFDPFVTSKPAGKGTGLGLSFCLATAERLGGRLTATNVAGGARFDLSLPIRQDQRETANAA